MVDFSRLGQAYGSKPEERLGLGAFLVCALLGLGQAKTAHILNDIGIRSRRGKKWNRQTISRPYMAACSLVGGEGSNFWKGE